MIYYDGRKVDKVQELADVSLLKGIIPRYDAAGNISPTGRTFKIEYDGETLLAKKRDDVYPELQKCPKIQEYLLEQLKKSTDVTSEIKPDPDDEMNEDEFEASLNSDNNEAEEIESDDEF